MDLKWSTPLTFSPLSGHLFVGQGHVQNIHPDSQDQFAFTWEGKQGTFTVLPMGYLHSPTICHGFVSEDLTGWDKLPTIQLYHYIDDVILTSDSLLDLRQAVYYPCLFLTSCSHPSKKVAFP